MSTLAHMVDEKDERSSDTQDASKMAGEIVRTVEEDKTADDGLTGRERAIEKTKQAERIRKAKELRKQLRKKELGLVKYRWPALVLWLGGALSIWSQFLVVMVHPPGIGFDNFVDGFTRSGNLFFLFPVVAGIVTIACGVFAYSNPKATFVSLVPAMMMAMSGMNVYFLIDFALAVDPEVQVSATGIPLTMLLTALISLLAILLRNKE